MTLAIPKALEGWSVLVVDDEPDNLDVACRLLKRAGAHVTTAENGVEALEVVKITRPDFILSDISMPEMDGWTLIKMLNRNRSTADIPTIALTAHAMEGDRIRAFEAGFVNYITKPLSIDKFVSDLLNILVDIPEFRARLKM
jgi:two-component system, cell cycle response regulator DivK